MLRYISTHKLSVLIYSLSTCFTIVSMYQTGQSDPSRKQIPISLSDSYANSRGYGGNLEYQELIEQYGIRFPEDEKSLQEMLDVFHQSPQRAQDIVVHLKDREYFNTPKYRYAIFIGLSGGGKTTTARAIAYQLMKDANWDALFFASGDIAGDRRHETSKELKRIFKIIAASNRKVLVIADELEESLKNYNSEHHDTGMTGRTLWPWLDKQKYEQNHKSFFIGLMNRLSGLPIEFHNRIRFRCIQFEALNILQLSTIFKNNLKLSGLQLTSDVDDSYLHNQFTESIINNGRDIEELVDLLKRDSKQYSNSSGLIVDKNLLEQIFTECKTMNGLMNYGHIDETDAQRQERHFEKTYKQNDLHFVQQFYKDNQLQSQSSQTYSVNAVIASGSHTPGKDVSKVEQVLTPEQRELARKEIFDQQEPKKQEEKKNEVKKPAGRWEKADLSVFQILAAVWKKKAMITHISCCDAPIGDKHLVLTYHIDGKIYLRYPQNNIYQWVPDYVGTQPPVEYLCLFH